MIITCVVEAHVSFFCAHCVLAVRSESARDSLVPVSVVAFEKAPSRDREYLVTWLPADKNFIRISIEMHLIDWVEVGGDVRDGWKGGVIATVADVDFPILQSEGKVVAIGENLALRHADGAL